MFVACMRFPSWQNDADGRSVEIPPQAVFVSCMLFSGSLLETPLLIWHIYDVICRNGRSAGGEFASGVDSRFFGTHAETDEVIAAA